MEIYSDILKKHGIEYCGALPFSACFIKNTRLLKNTKTVPLTAIMFLIPYRIYDGKDSNISSYAVSRDYHLFAKELFSDIVPSLCKAYPGYDFYGFADHSPIYETEAACRAGLGILGDNGLIINDTYGSYVFIGEILTDAPPHLFRAECHEIKGCTHCGACLRLCPYKNGSSKVCLSELTQKKGELSASEAVSVKRFGSAWGCDICQTACPLNDSVKDSPIEFFAKERIPYLTYEEILLMSEEEFKKRAYSWRGRNTVVRNLEILKSSS